MTHREHLTSGALRLRIAAALTPDHRAAFMSSPTGKRTAHFWPSPIAGCWKLPHNRNRRHRRRRRRLILIHTATNEPCPNGTPLVRTDQRLQFQVETSGRAIGNKNYVRGPRHCLFASTHRRRRTAGMATRRRRRRCLVRQGENESRRTVLARPD